MNLTFEIAVAICGNIVAFGVFVGMTKSSQKFIKEVLTEVKDRLQRIEDKQDKQNEEISDMRERIAVVENVLQVRKRNN